MDPFRAHPASASASGRRTEPSPAAATAAAASASANGNGNGSLNLHAASLATAAAAAGADRWSASGPAPTADRRNGGGNASGSGSSYEDGRFAGRRLAAVSTGEAMNPSRRCTMEDAIAVLPAGTWGNSSGGNEGAGPSSAAADEYNLLAVYDGHGGRDMVDFVRHALHHHLAAELEHLRIEGRRRQWAVEEDGVRQAGAAAEAAAAAPDELDRFAAASDDGGGGGDDEEPPALPGNGGPSESPDPPNAYHGGGGEIDVPLALERAFLVTDIHAKAAGIGSSGATVAVALVKKLPDRVEIVTANAGDARIVLCTRPLPQTQTQPPHPVHHPPPQWHRPPSRGAATAKLAPQPPHPWPEAAAPSLLPPVVAVRLTSDHNCSSESERDRIRRSGGFVYRGRVAGVLAVTRSLGDQALKRYVLAQPHICTATTRTPASRLRQSLSGSGDPEDFTNKENRCASAAAADCGAAADPPPPGPGSLGDFLIVACDGLWDVVDDQSAADFVAEQLRRGADPSAVAPMLVREALRRGTGDNVSVIVAFL